MNEKKQTKKRNKGGGIVYIIIGILLISSGLSLVLYNAWDSRRAGKEASEIEAELEKQISQVPLEEKVLELDEMPTIEIDGLQYIGILEVPDYDLHLPVLAEWSYSNLRIAPCRYTGSYLNDDLVLCAHNYATHFGKLRNIDIGAHIYFIDAVGNQHSYIVSNREIVRPRSIDEMIENSSNSDSTAEWDLTLFTCTPSGRTRCAVRCVLEDSSERKQSE